jgi:dGTPase
MVEAADDICYEIMDIEDSHKLKILSYEETERLLLGFFDKETQNKIKERIIHRFRYLLGESYKGTWN